MNQEQRIANDELKKKCGYTKGRTCSNCKHFEDAKVVGISYYCADERNALPCVEGARPFGILIESDGLCNYWEPSYTELPEAIEDVRG